MGEGKDVLNDREIYVLNARQRGMTLQAIGEVLGRNRERVRQIEKKALRRLEQEKRLREAMKGPDVLSWPLRDFGWSCRVLNCLLNDNIETVGDLVRLSSAELLRAPNFGRKSLKEVKGELANLGLTLADPVFAPETDQERLERIRLAEEREKKRKAEFRAEIERQEIREVNRERDIWAQRVKELERMTVANGYSPKIERQAQDEICRILEQAR